MLLLCALPLLLGLAVPLAGHHLRFATVYDYAAEEHNFSSFGWAGGSTPPPWQQFDDNFKRLGFRSMVDISNRCDAGWKVYDAPFCPAAGRGRGLATNWTAAVDRYVAAVRVRPWVVGVFFGDEPVISGVPQSQVCELVAYTKRALVAANRADIFTYYNDAPAPLLEMPVGLCAGLDFISADIYLPATLQQAGAGAGTLIEREASAVKKIYDVVKQKLLPSQKLFVVPGVFWDGGGNESVWKAQPVPPLAVQERYVAMLEGYWQYSMGEPAVVGWNCWHYLDRGWAAGGTGIKGMGQVVQNKVAEIGRRIVTGGNAPPPPPPPPSPPSKTRPWMELGWMSYTAPDVRLLPNASVATLQLGGNLSLLLESHQTYGLPGLLNLQESQWGSHGPPARSTAAHVLYDESKHGWVLTADWESAAADAIATLRPLVEDGSITGLMLGDELVCSGLPLANLSALASRLRAGLHSANEVGFFLYTNECFPADITHCHTAADCAASSAWGAGHTGGGPATCRADASLPPSLHGYCMAAVWPELPAALDFLSLDAYDVGDAEYTRVDNLLNRYIFPLLQPHQKAWIVPGLYGRNGTQDNETALAETDALLVQKLAAYWALYAAHDKVGGLMAWHWNSLESSFSPSSMTLGGALYPRTMELWAQIRTSLNIT